MKGLGFVVAATATAVAFIAPAIGGWAFAGAELMFATWLRRRMRAMDAAALAAQAREPLSDDELELVRRYAYYFAYPATARECASTLAALGLASLLLVPWLSYKLEFLPAILIGVMLFWVARLTKRVSPVDALRLATARGDRDALRLLSAHDSARQKLSGHH